MEITELANKANKIAEEKLFWDDYNRQTDERVKLAFLCERLLLTISEITESMESLRKPRRYDGTPELMEELLQQSKENPAIFQMRFIHHVKDTFEDEIADAFIRLADLCKKMNIDIDSFIRMKMEFNSLRPAKHDKLF